MKRVLKAIAPTIIAFTIYIIYTGSLKVYDLVSGAVVAIVIGSILSPMLVEDWRKSLDIKRFLYLIVYILRYFLIDEMKAHIHVIKLGLSPRMAIRPGIVRVPIGSKSDYAWTLVSISITNTPGTVVVDVDKEKGLAYVNWINVTTTDPLECYKNIAQVFDSYAKKIFD